MRPKTIKALWIILQATIARVTRLEEEVSRINRERKHGSNNDA